MSSRFLKRFSTLTNSIFPFSCLMYLNGMYPVSAINGKAFNIISLTCFALVCSNDTYLTKSLMANSANLFF